jgi:hypothetical protein
MGGSTVLAAGTALQQAGGAHHSLLQVAVSDNQCFESTVHGLESVTCMITRYAAFEVLYMGRGSLVRAELQSKLTNLYARILTFLAHGVAYFRQNTARECW